MRDGVGSRRGITYLVDFVEWMPLTPLGYRSWSLFTRRLPLRDWS
jgi:hypothetical protein